MTLQDALEILSKEEVWQNTHEYPYGTCVYPVLNDGGSNWAPSILIDEIGKDAEQEVYLDETGIYKIKEDGYIDTTVMFAIEDERE